MAIVVMVALVLSSGRGASLKPGRMFPNKPTMSTIATSAEGFAMATGLTRNEAKEFYDRLGAKQDLQAFYENPAIEELITHGAFNHANAVLEFGCGTGRLAERLLATYLPNESRYLGLDISSTMVGLARERLNRWHDRAEVRLSDGSADLEVPGKSFDRFVSTYVLDLLSPEDIRALLVEAHRVLSPEGRLCLVGLTHGVTPLSRLVSWGWEHIYSRRPKLVGGCRPIHLLGYLSPDMWEIERQVVVTSFGISSQVVVALRTASGK